jgi:hypothetical protein
VRLTQEGLEIIPESSFWLPEPESEPALLGRIDPAYRAIREASQIVIIGYSFGMTAGGMFDEVSFNAFVEYCSGNEARVIVVSPSPRDLTECLADSLRSHHVHAVPVYWNLVCRVFLEIIREHNLADLIRVSRFPDEVVRRYNQLLNGYN